MYIGSASQPPAPPSLRSGSGGDSVNGAFLAARILVRALQGNAEKDDALWGFTR